MIAQEILDHLSSAGYRLTAQRRRLVSLLLKAEAPMTAEEIYRSARKARLGANLSTIYRNLATFCETGWLEVVPGANGERYYQVRREDEQRLSVLCLDCGQMTSHASVPTGPLNEAVRGMGFKAEGLRVTLAAHCEHVCPRKTGE